MSPGSELVRLTLSEAATATVSIERVKRGQATPTGSLPPVDARSGANRQRFDGRIDGKALRPGTYRATLVATNATGTSSAPATLTFKVARNK